MSDLIYWHLDKEGNLVIIENKLDDSGRMLPGKPLGMHPIAQLYY
jgi:hypothetical protein